MSAGLNEVVAVLTGGSFTSLTRREQGALQVEMQDALLGAPISVVKQPYAYFNKELGQQIDASDVECSTVLPSHPPTPPSTPKTESKPQQQWRGLWHLPVNNGPTVPPRGFQCCPERQLTGKTVTSQLRILPNLPLPNPYRGQLGK